MNSGRNCSNSSRLKQFRRQGPTPTLFGQFKQGNFMEMLRVNSTAIVAIGYDEQNMRMKITFKQGDTYDFCRVPKYIFVGLYRAQSKGTYYNLHIKDKYQC